MALCPRLSCVPCVHACVWVSVCVCAFMYCICLQCTRSAFWTTQPNNLTIKSPPHGLYHTQKEYICTYICNIYLYTCAKCGLWKVLQLHSPGCSFTCACNDVTLSPFAGQIGYKGHTVYVAYIFCVWLSVCLYVCSLCTAHVIKVFIWLWSIRRAVQRSFRLDLLCVRGEWEITSAVRRGKGEK